MVDPVLMRVAELSARARGDNRAGARAGLLAVWADIGGESADPLHRCAVAHALADVQDHARDELAWDLRALDAAGLVTDDRAARAGIGTSAAGLFASLHLNVGDCARRLGDGELAREHWALGVAAVAVLEAGGYGEVVREALRRLALRLDSAER